MTHSLKRYLLLGILCPVLVFMLVNTFSIYQQALQAADIAYDRTLPASAKAIGEVLEVVEVQGQPQLRSSLPSSVLEAFEADLRSRMFFRINGFDQRMVAGYQDLPSPRPPPGESGPYAALVDFYDATYRGEPVRMAVLLQPVSGVAGWGMATVQVAETLELRHALAHEMLLGMAWKQGVLFALITAVVVVVVQRGTKPLRLLGRHWQARAEDDFSPLSAKGSPREIWPVVEAANAVMQRLDRLLQQQKRFVRDASHQLRTPLTVLKVLVQSARRGDVDPERALREIEFTVDGAVELANQMLALAKAEQLHRQQSPGAADWALVVRSVALDLAPLMAERNLDLDLDLLPCRVRAHEWGLRELTRNLLHNAIRHSPLGGRLGVHLAPSAADAVLCISDEGPGIDDSLRPVLFQPFARGDSPDVGPSGLGLAICREVVLASGGTLQLENRGTSLHQEGLGAHNAQGLDAVVTLPLEDVETPGSERSHP